jgi:hypothetical protein
MIDMLSVLTALAREQQLGAVCSGAERATAPLLVFEVGIPKREITSEHRVQVSSLLAQAHTDKLVEITGHVMQRGASEQPRPRPTYRLTEAGYAWLAARSAA